MRRFCNADGEWEKPDTTECRTRELVQVFKQITNITGVADAVAVLDSLTNISKSDSSAYGGDLLLLSDMLLNIASKISHSESSSVEVMQQYVQVFMERECQLLSPGYEDLWMQAYREHGPNDGVIKVFAALEQLSNTVYEVMRQSGQNVILSNGTIALRGVFVNSTKEYIVDTAGISISTKRRLLQEINPDVPESYLKVSQKTLDKIKSSRSTGMPLAVISYVYQNPGDILPSDAVTTRPKLRQWVKSITAVTRIKKVNTPVISVSVYPKLQGDIDIDVQMRMYTKEDGYSPKCSSMEVEAKYGIWTTNSCSLTVRDAHEIWEYIECACSRFGNFAVIMTIGKEPKPFVEAAAKVVLTISCALSSLLIVISITAVCMARLTSDFYLVLGQVILSLGIFPILVAIDANFAAGENKESCQLIAAFSHYALLSNSVWMMNLSIPFFKRLKHFVYKSTSARLIYAFCGWVIPCVVFINWKEQFPMDDKQQSCLVAQYSAISLFSHLMALLLAGVTILAHCYNYNMLTELVSVFKGPEERILCNKMETSMILHIIMIFCRCVNILEVMTDKPVYSVYILASFIFMEGSVIFLGYVATNEEILIVLRARYFEKDEEYKQALQDFEFEDSERLKIQKDVLKERVKEGQSRFELRLRRPQIAVVKVGSGTIDKAIDARHTRMNPEKNRIVLEDMSD
ncbi:adhesion G protein-coupled receptor B1-like [Ptychodera flava]|uniref:adhesion G protein-coupled receptor B1-like n=1 Tax=Ptychodera flava TaxID=63121 RepID=UPI00396A52BC